MFKKINGVYTYFYNGVSTDWTLQTSGRGSWSLISTRIDASGKPFSLDFTNRRMAVSFAKSNALSLASLDDGALIVAHHSLLFLNA